MNGKITTSCHLFLLSAWAHATESNLRGGGSRSLVPEPEVFGFVGGEVNPLASPTFTTVSASSPFQLPMAGDITAAFPSIQAVPSTLPFQFPTSFDFTTLFPSIPASPSQLDPADLFDLGSRDFDFGDFIGGFGPEGPQFPGPNFDFGDFIGGFGLEDPEDPVIGEGSCPKGPDGTPCTLDYAPVSCDGCEYANFCSAEAAGFIQGQCQPVSF
jgi:hypothetical protein